MTIASNLRGNEADKVMVVVVSGDGRRVYVSNGCGNSVTVLDARSYKILTTIPIASRPWGIAISR